MDGMDQPVQPPASHQHRSRQRWIPWVAGGGVFLITVLLGSILVADWAWRTAQMQELLERVEASEAIMGELNEAVELAFEEHSTSGDRAKLDTELRDLAASAKVDIAAAGAEVAALPIAAWHGDLERARDAYLLHNEAWVEYMDRASASSAEFIAPQPVVNETFFAAQPLFIEALPAPDVRDLAARVAAIFALPEEMSADQVTT